MASKKSTPLVGASGGPSTTKPTASATPAGAPITPAPDAPKLKQKLVRDSFTIPKTEYAVLDALKQRATQLKRPAKKGEILRAGIAALKDLPDTAFLTALNAVPSLKTGRPKGAEPTKAAELLPSAARAAAQVAAKALAKAPAKAVPKSAAKSAAKVPTKALTKAPARAREKAPVKAPAPDAVKVLVAAARKPSGKVVVKTR